MKKIYTIVCAALLIGGLAGASEAVKGAKKDFETFKTEMQHKLGNIEIQLSELKSEAAKTGDEAKNKAVHELEESRDHVQAQLNDLKQDSKGQWKKLKESIAKSADELNAKVHNALNK